MPVQFRDYYETLGVSKTATSDDIRKAFRKLARQHHPDVAKDKKAAEEKFKQINEAYEVLSDKDKREKYDLLGADWQKYGAGGGGGVNPFGTGGRPGRGGGGVRPGPGGGVEFDFGGTGYSDFFERFFGGRGRGGNGGAGGGFDFFGGGGGTAAPERGADVEADISVTLEESLQGSRRPITLRRTDARGQVKNETYDVKIPAGVHEGQRIRLRSRGEAGSDGGAAGDLYLRVRLAPHPDFRVEAGGDLYHDLAIAPWRAVLGTEVPVPTLEGPSMKLTIPAGAQVRPAVPPARAWSAQNWWRTHGPVRAGRRDAARKPDRRGARALGTARLAPHAEVRRREPSLRREKRPAQGRRRCPHRASNDCLRPSKGRADQT